MYEIHVGTRPHGKIVSKADDPLIESYLHGSLSVEDAEVDRGEMEQHYRQSAEPCPTLAIGSRKHLTVIALQNEPASVSDKSRSCEYDPHDGRRKRNPQKFEHVFLP